MNNLYDLLITQDLSARLIGKFLGQTQKVIIEISGVKIKDKVCDPIANTGRWSWPIKNMPENSCGDFRYIMTSDLGEVFEGKFSIPKGVDNGC